MPRQSREEQLSSKSKDWRTQSSIAKFVLQPLQTAMYNFSPAVLLHSREKQLMYFGKIFNNKGFLNNFQLNQEIIHPALPPLLAQVFQLVKVSLRHISIEKCRRQLSRN